MALLVRVQRPSDVPLESLHGRKDDLGRTLRLTVRAVLAPEALGEFSLEAAAGGRARGVRAAVAAAEELEIAGRVNALARGADRKRGRRAPSIEDVALRARRSSKTSACGLPRGPTLPRAHASSSPRPACSTIARPQRRARRSRDARCAATPVFTYLANTMRIGTREVPYSLVTAIDLATVAPGSDACRRAHRPPIVLERVGRARSPGARRRRRDARILRVGGAGPSRHAHADFQLCRPSCRSPRATAIWRRPARHQRFADARRLGPAVPARPAPHSPRGRGVLEGVSDDAEGVHPARGRAAALAVALRRDDVDSRSCRRDGEPLADVATAFRRVCARALDPLATGLAVRDVRAEALAASRGATDFGEYFVYFSFFLVVSALLLASLFFKLGVEQRGREVGLLRAVGFEPRAVRRLFLARAWCSPSPAAPSALRGAIAYAWLLMIGLRTWWVDAVGTTALSLHVTPLSLVGGAVGGIVAALACIWWTLRGLTRISERSLLSGSFGRRILQARLSEPRSPCASAAPGRLWLPASAGRRADTLSAAAVVLALLGSRSSVLPSCRRRGATGAFFGAGAALLGACSACSRVAYRRPPRASVAGHGWRPVARLGLRNATYRPGRSVLSMAVIASATFILISVDAFRRDEGGGAADRQSGVGGYS